MYTRIDLLKDIYEYEKEMREYDERHLKDIQNRQKEITHDKEYETRACGELHTESV